MTTIPRTITQDLMAWKQMPARKPLILRGARQTGKSHTLLEFGQRHFPACHLFDFQETPELDSLFDGALSPAGIIESLELFLDTSINTDTDLVIFDEIQSCPRALASVKYFCEKMPGLALCCAGSLLGVTYADDFFPVGKVTFLDLYPLSLVEFLDALGEKKMLTFLQDIDTATSIPELLHDRFLKLMREYFVVGGLPEVVNAYRANRQHRKSAFEQVRALQQDLLDGYVRDFAKYGGTTRPERILAVYSAIPALLAREYKKFVPSKVISGGRYGTLHTAIDWLAGAGLVIKVPIVNSGEVPLFAFTQENRFKLYFFDTGLLGALAQLPPGTIYTQADPFATFKGAFCENFVAQELRQAHQRPLYCWTSNTAEVEFLLELDGQVLPIEVKAGKSGKLKSLNVFAEKYAPPFRTRFSSRNLEFNHQAALHSYPLYLCGRFPL